MRHLELSDLAINDTLLGDDVLDLTTKIFKTARIRTRIFTLFVSKYFLVIDKRGESYF